MIDKFYIDLFFKCQETGKYRIFTFDIKNSKKMKNRYQAQLQIFNLIDNIYKDLKQLEIKLDKKILLDEEGYTHYTQKNENSGFAFKYEPFVIGDMVGLTIYNGSIDNDIIYEIFEKNKKQLNIDFDFHINSGVYETDDYGLGNKECFRGYCIQIVSNLHKEGYKNVREHIEKKYKIKY